MGRLLAGEYPGAKSLAEARQKIASFLDAGVTLFLDLTEAGEYQLRPYAAIAAELAGERGLIVTHHRMPIVDVSVPTPAQMERILVRIDQALAQGQTVYVHCYGGIGRTGTVIGCWLVRHGLSGRRALAGIKRWRRETPDGWRQSPETDEQWRMVMEWGR
jgi:protein-tyrosine phosphatase